MLSKIVSTPSAVQRAIRYRTIAQQPQGAPIDSSSPLSFIHNNQYLSTGATIGQYIEVKDDEAQLTQLGNQMCASIRGQTSKPATTDFKTQIYVQDREGIWNSFVEIVCPATQRKSTPVAVKQNPIGKITAEIGTPAHIPGLTSLSNPAINLYVGG